MFAPTNSAFAALLTELGVTKAQLLANKPLLTAVLEYHVISGEVRKTDIPLGKAIEPLSGGFFKIDTAGAGYVITDGRNRTSNIVTADVMTTNGVVHVIDKVLLPADKDIVQTAMALPDFSILVEAVTAAGLADTLSGPGPFTVFAPTNDAFTALFSVVPPATALSCDVLPKVLAFHVVRGRQVAADVRIAVLQTHQWAAAADPNGATKPVTEFKGHLFDRDGSPLPSGTVVEAYAGDARCGLTSLRAGDENEGFYTLIVSGPESVPGCTAGAQLNFRLDGRDASQTAVNNLRGDAGGSEIDLTVK